MNYTTQMDAAKKGIITKEMETVAKKENRTPEYIRDLLAQGKIVIPANKNHKSLSAEGVGEGLKTKINVNLGISKDCPECAIKHSRFKQLVYKNASEIVRG